MHVAAQWRRETGAALHLVRVGLGSVLLALLAGFSPPSLWGQERVIPLDTFHIHVGSRVSAEVPALTRSIQVLDLEAIEALPVRTLSGLLEYATGVDVMSRSPAQSDLSIRGAGFEQVVVLVNGVRMSDPQTGHFDLDLAVPLDQVERVEILRGAASALYGADAVGGVVNVVTQAGRTGWKARGEGGSWETGRLAVSGGLGGGTGLSIQGGGELSRSDGHREGTDYETALLHLSGSGPVAGGQAAVEFGFGRRDFGAKDFYVASLPSFEKTRTYTSSARWAVGGMTLGASYRSHEDEFTLIREEPQVYQNQHTSSQGGLEILFRGGEAHGMSLAMGGEIYRDRVESNNLGDHGETRWALFGEAAIGRGGPAALTLGLREDWHEGFGTFISPSVSASYQGLEMVRFRVAVGRSFRAPTWTDRYYSDPGNVGQEDLDPEQAWSMEAGADLLRGPFRRLSVTAFHRRAKDLIDWARPVGADDVPWETRNVEEATFRGLEADLSLTGPLGIRISSGATLLSVDSEEAVGFQSKYALRPFRQRVTVGLGRTFEGGLSVDLHGQRGKRGGEEAYHRLDLKTGYRFRAFTLYLNATNLLDSEYPDASLPPDTPGALAPGRALFLGMELGGGRD